MEFVNIFVICLICYFIGSVPTAYIIVRFIHKKDITKEGSGNVGALNSAKVSSSKTTGIIVLLIDMLKGFIPLYFMLFIFKLDYSVVMPGSTCIILGHNFPVWLGLKGGRGLATGAGMFVILNYFVLIGWCAAWLISFGIKRNILIGNVVATVLIPLYIFAVNKFDFLVVSWGLNSYSLFYFSLFSVITALIVVSKHLEIFIKNK